MRLVSQEYQAQAEVEAEVDHGRHLFLGRGKDLLVAAAAAARVEAFSFQMIALEQLRESVSRLPLDKTIDLELQHPPGRSPPHPVHLTVARSCQATHQNYG